MAIIVEDGTGLDNAQCYCSVAYFDAYLAERGIDNGYIPEAKEAALVVAAKDWIDGGHSFKYEQLTTTQALQFPRTEVGFPEAIKLANAKAAQLYLHGALLVDVTSISTTGIIEAESSTLGPLSESIKYKSGSAQIYSRILPADLTNLLRPYLSTSGMMGTAHRA